MYCTNPQTTSGRRHNVSYMREGKSATVAGRRTPQNQRQQGATASLRWATTENGQNRAVMPDYRAETPMQQTQSDGRHVGEGDREGDHDAQARAEAMTGADMV